MATKTLITRIVLRNDTYSNWAAVQDKVLVKGEPAVVFFEDGSNPKLKIGDGVTSFENLPYVGGSESNVFEVTVDPDADHLASITTQVGETKLEKGNIAIVKEKIISDNQNLYSYTAYVYNGTVWSAMDGNYDATNVYFPDDMMVTKEVGYITLTNGQGTIPSKGKNLKEVFEAMYVKEQNPKTTNPSVSLTFSQAKAYEVGTVVSPEYSATFNAGSYTYGPATGCTVSAWEVTDTAGNSATTASGSFDNVTVTDTTNYRITAKATYTAGATPVTNKGNAYETGKISAGSTTKISGAITGYRNTFYGTLTTKDTLDSSAIRGLTKSNAALSNGAKFNVTIPVGALRVVIAYPSSLRAITSVLDVNGMNANITSSFASSTISVEGANGATAIDYRVYTLDFASANDTSNTFAVTI